MDQLNPKIATPATAEEMLRLAEHMAMPLDLDQLVSDGVLRRHGKTWFEVLDFDRLPEHAKIKVKTIKQVTGKPALVQFSKAGKSAEALVKRLRDRAAQ